MYIISEVEKELLNSMIGLSKDNIVKATKTEIIKNAGKKSNGGIYTHAFHNLESMGLIRQISKYKWVILEKDIKKEGKGSKLVFKNTNRIILEDTIEDLHKLKKSFRGDNNSMELINTRLKALQYYLKFN